MQINSALMLCCCIHSCSANKIMENKHFSNHPQTATFPHQSLGVVRGLKIKQKSRQTDFSPHPTCISESIFLHIAIAIEYNIDCAFGCAFCFFGSSGRRKDLNARRLLACSSPTEAGFAPADGPPPVRSGCTARRWQCVSPPSACSILT